MSKTPKRKEPPATPSLPGLERSWLLVGKLLWEFAQVESALNDLISKLLALNARTGPILLSNVDLRRKINLARCGIEEQWAGLLTHKVTVRSKLWSDLNGLADARNVAAHSAYFPSADGVQFLYAQAREKLTFPEAKWAESKFRQHSVKAAEVFVDLMTLKQSCSPVRDPSTFFDVLQNLGMSSSGAPGSAIPPGKGLLSTIFE